MGLFKKKTVTKTYDKENKKPVIKASTDVCCFLFFTSSREKITVNATLFAEGYM